MTRALLFLLAFLATAPAHAQDCREQIAKAEARAKEAPGEATPLHREAVACLHRLAGALLQASDLANAERVVEQARAYIVANLGAEDIAMAGNRQVFGVIRFRRGDREAARDAFAHAARIRNAKLDIWDESEGPMGAVGHKPSGLKLPARAGALLQFRRDINNDDGTDVSLGYRANGREGGVSVTLYVYRPQGEFAAVFDQEKRAIRTFNPNAIAQGEEAMALDTPAGKVEGRVARFEYPAKGGPLGTRLYLFPLKGDYLKLRVTFAAPDASFVDQQVAALLGGIGWPKP